MCGRLQPRARVCPLLRMCTSTTAEETLARLHKSKVQLTMVNTVQLTYPVVSRPLWHGWDIFTQVSKEHDFTQAQVGVSLGLFLVCFFGFGMDTCIPVWMSPWVWVDVVSIHYRYHNLSVLWLSFCPFGGLGFSSLSMSSTILALLHAVEGDINDRN